jgi:hypothetical protein
MPDLSTKDPIFLDRVRSFNTSPEVLVLVRYSRAAGLKSFRLLSSFSAFELLLNPLPPSTAITIFKNPGLPHRGIVDDSFITHCLAAIIDGTEYLVLDIENNCFCAGEAHEELRADLQGLRGQRVAVGTYPPFLLDTDEIITAYVPDKNGIVAIGKY